MAVTLSTNRRSHNEHPLGIIPVNEKCDLHFLDNHSQLATWLGQAMFTSATNRPMRRALPLAGVRDQFNLMISFEGVCELLHTSVVRTISVDDKKKPRNGPRARGA